MRTTVTFDDDTAAAVQQLQRELGVGVSAAVNELVRRGIGRRPRHKPFVQRTSPGQALIDVTDIGDTLDVLDGPAAP